MINQKRFKDILPVLVFICVSSLASQIAMAESTTYVVGVVPQFESRQINAIWHPLLKELENKTGLRFKLQPSPDIPEFERQFEHGEFDMLYLNPYHLIVANQAQGYLPILKDVGVKLYGIIVVRKDSPYTNLRDLDGKTIAFPAPNALGAALIPRAEFERNERINIIPKYVRSHSSVYLNVFLKQVSAGGGVQKTFNRQPDHIKDQLRILHKTVAVASHPIAVHPRMKTENASKIAQAFLELGKSSGGKKLLSKIPINQVGPASLSDYEDLKNLGLEQYYVR